MEDREIMTKMKTRALTMLILLGIQVYLFLKAILHKQTIVSLPGLVPLLVVSTIPINTIVSSLTTTPPTRVPIIMGLSSKTTLSYLWLSTPIMQTRLSTTASSRIKATGATVTK